MSTKRIIIVGGGFGGVECAQTLCSKLGRGSAEIVLFNTENHMVFSPLLAEAVGSSINPLDVVVPLRQLLPHVACRTEEVLNIDMAGNAIQYEAEDGHCEQLAFDQLILACGNATNLNVVPGMADHAFPLKTVGDATALRSHIMAQLERAEVCADPERRRWYLTFIVVGGGFSGAEAAGEINDLVRDTACWFKNFDGKDVSVILIHSRDHILPEISADLRNFARKKMEKAGVQMVLEARVALATPEGVGLQEGRFIKGGTIICTVGNSPARMVEKLSAPKEKGRLITEPDMRLKGCQNIWAIGDCSRNINAFDGQLCPTTAQFAVRQGRQCARNVIRVLRGEQPVPFSFKPLGELCSIGGHSAVADMMGVHLSGFLAWVVWRGVYLFKLPTWARRLQVGFDWAWLLLFPRDLAHLRTRPSDRVSHAHYEPGDYIIRQGDAPASFYVIEQGEVEVVRATEKDPEGEVIAVLGPGSFFGERALLMGSSPRVASVRARTPLEVLVMGKNVFTQISGALAPLRDALAQALNRRSIDAWKDEPQAHDLLKRILLKELMEPPPQPLLKPTMSLREAGRAFVEYGNEFFYVSSDGGTLEGVVTMTDLLRGRGSGSTDNTLVCEFMSKNPVALAADDNCAVASSAIREFRLKSLPVVEGKNKRKIVGCIRARRLMGYVFKELGSGGDAAAREASADAGTAAGTPSTPREGKVKEGKPS